MYEENGRFSWTSLFIKIIIIIIFVLFTIWLLSLSTKNATKGLSNSLNVLTDNIYQENIDRMKDVGKSYFTTERLPEKVGDVKTLTLASMYDKNLILEVKDKNGKACSAKNSYVSVEKLETEYQMKVYLECGNESNFIKVIMGCYNYCSTDICEKKDNVKPVTGIEYQYSKTTGGKWTSWGNWSEWSKTNVTKTNYRDVETKTVNEDYTYDKTITDSKYMGEATCPKITGYNYVSTAKGVCNYTKTVTTTEEPKCAQTYNGYNLVSQNGFTCNYSKGTTITTSPVACAKTYNDYDLTSQNGFTCNYSKNTYKTTNPVSCSQTYNGYNLASQNGFTCNYSKTVTNQECYQVPVGVKTVTPCSGCGVQVVTVYDTKCEDESSTATTTTTVGCPSGYTKSNGTCVANKATAVTTTTTVGCPSGYTKSNGTCVKSTTATTTTTLACAAGFEKRGTICAKDNVYKLAQDAICSEGQRMSEGKCYKDTTHTERVTETRTVTYYRYRLREYVGGTTDYKWSTSNNDKSLLNAGYKLTGKTRNIGGK